MRASFVLLSSRVCVRHHVGHTNGQRLFQRWKNEICPKALLSIALPSQNKT